VAGNASGAAAAGALDVELHPPAHLRHLSRAVALRAGHGTAGMRHTVARRTDFLPVDLDARLAAADRRPEIDGRLVLEIGAGFRPARALLLLRSRKNAGEDVFEAAPGRLIRSCARMRTTLEAGKIEPTKIDGNAATLALLARIGFCLSRVDLVGIEAELVVDLALL